MPHSKSGHYRFFHKFNQLWAICLVKEDSKICGAVIKTTSGSPTGLKKHLANFHKNSISVSEPAPKQVKITNFHGVELFSDSFKKDLAILVAKDLLPPYKICNSEILRKWAFSHWKTEIPRCSKTIWKIVEEYVQFTQAKIMNHCLSVEKYPALTADEWTCRMGQRFLNVNIHFDQKQFNLGLMRIDQAANAGFLSSLIQSKIDEYGINCLFITTDGASVMGAVAKKLHIYQQKCFFTWDTTCYKGCYVCSTNSHIKRTGCRNDK